MIPIPRRANPGAVSINGFAGDARLVLPWSLALLERGQTGIHGVLAEFLFDAEQLIVFRQTIRAAQGTGLDLAAVRRHGDVGDGGVFGFAGAMREDGGVAIELRELDGIERLGGVVAGRPSCE